MQTKPSQAAKIPPSKFSNFCRTQFSAWDVLLIFIFVAFAAAYCHHAIVLFFSCCLGIIPLAAQMGKATEHLAERVGEGLGGLLNATFGNACEFIIAISALKAGYYEIVKASLTGSIIGNILLVLGASILAGGLKWETQTFNRTAATTSATLLALGAISLIVPAIFHHFSPAHSNEDEVALGISIILFSTYLLSLLFSLRTHKHLYIRQVDKDAAEAIGIASWGTGRSLGVLITCTVLVAVLSEMLVHAVGEAAEQLKMNQVFIGVILVAIIGNAAEHSTAILMALKNKMDLAINISLGSGAQIALLIAPMLVFCSYFIGPKPMDLFFSAFEVLSIGVSVIILGFIATDGECNWMEGVQLLAVYLILSVAFFFA